MTTDTIDSVDLIDAIQAYISATPGTPECQAAANTITALSQSWDCNYPGDDAPVHHFVVAPSGDEYRFVTP